MNVVLLSLWACTLGKEITLGDSGINFQRPDEQGSQGGTEENTDTEEGMASSVGGNIVGSIDIELYREWDDGEREPILWDFYEGVFPFGKIFVAAYYEDATGNYIYVGHDVVYNTQPTGNLYDIAVEAPADQPLRVFALLDYYVDDVTGTDEPIGAYNRTIILEDGEEFTIRVPKDIEESGRMKHTREAWDDYFSIF